MDFNMLDESEGFLLRANELWLLYYQQNQYPLASGNNIVNPGFACYALWQSFNDMAIFLNYAKGPFTWNGNANSFNIALAMTQAYGSPPHIFIPIMMSGFVDNDDLIPFCNAVSGNWSCIDGCIGGGFEDVWGSLESLFGTPKSPNKAYNCYNDCNNPAAYTAVSALEGFMESYVKTPNSSDSALMNNIAGQIVAINTIIGLTDGYLTGLQKFINAPLAGFNNSLKAPGSLVHFSSPENLDIGSLSALLNQTSDEGNGNGFYQLLVNIMSWEFGNAGETPSLSCTAPGTTGYCNWLSCPQTSTECPDGSCCPQKCNGDNTCCGKGITPLGFPDPAKGCTKPSL